MVRSWCLLLIASDHRGSGHRRSPNLAKIMGETVASVLQRALENLDKDEETRKSALRAVNLCVKDLDPNGMPVILAQIYEATENGTLPGEQAISLYEIIARFHGPKMVPYISSIMSTVVKALASSSGSISLQQACSKVVSATARYAVDLTTPVERKRCVIQFLCEPLSDSLLASQESVSSGSALCMKVLVESTNWRFASDKMVNKVCQNVAGALQGKSSQSNAIMDLVVALANHNALALEAYARLLIQSGLKLLNVSEGNFQKCYAAIQMLNCLMKCLDPRSIYSEVETIIEEMEKCQSDHLPCHVKGSAYEALKTAKKIACKMGSQSGNGSGSPPELDFSGGGQVSRRKVSSCADDQPSPSVATRSQLIDSYGGGSLVESPVPKAPLPSNVVSDGGCVDKTFSEYDQGGEDVAFTDRSLSEMVCDASICNSTCKDFKDVENGEEFTEGFERLCQQSCRNDICLSRTPSPRKCISQVNVCSIKSFTKKRNNLHSIQSPTDYGNQAQQHRSRSSGLERIPPAFRNEVHYNIKRNARLSSNGEQQTVASESVSSTEDGIDDTDAEEVMQALHGIRTVTLKSRDRKKCRKSASRMILSLLFTALVICLLLLQTDSTDEDYLVPT